MPRGNTIFDVTGSHIILLDDADLRMLVARLCEAELLRAGLPVAAVTAGGDQNAADGGLDVRVELPPDTPISGFVPRPATGFQVKVPDMPPAKILKEMRPRGVVRPVIRELAAVSGAYIIVSANGSTADSALRRRQKAMRDAVSSLPDAVNLTLDFYDRDRLARWVRQHPGLVVWVREQIGQAISGWRPYANWSTASVGIGAEYLLDGKTRLHDWRSGPLTVVDGIQRIRAVLAQPRGVVRLVGLSGTGKTRLVQALFDPRVGDGALDQMLAIYTDPGDEPQPLPRDLMRRLIQNRQRAIMIIDNCLPETHRALAAICAVPASNVSLITVEFDVGEDEPEGTEVFRLEPASDEVIEHLLARRAPHASEADRRRIAEFSGGNARMALALAHTIRRGDSITRLADNELFERLFHQRNARDDSLMRGAEVCSLVYSFNGEALEGESAELPLLADMASKTVVDLYRHVDMLLRRGLVQRRGPWRAVLPQALADKLASQALDRIPPAKILAVFLDQAGERLLRSFTRRLGHLHDSEPAQQMVLRWLSPGGLLSDVGQLSSLSVAMLDNVAPVDPAAALAAIERAASGPHGDSLFSLDNGHRGTWISLLASIAYEAALFSRAVALLARFAMAERQDRSGTHAHNALRQLFFIELSGTHASVEQRLQAVDAFINAEGAAAQALGFAALDALLETWHFVGRSPDFGARSRDYGWWPASRDEVVTWYSTAVRYVGRLALADSSLAAGAATVLAKQFRGLWNNAGIADELEATARAIAEQGFWLEGWAAIKQTIRYDAERMAPKLAGRLFALEQELRPDGLLQTARAYLLSSLRDASDIVDDDSLEDGRGAASARSRAGEITETLGYDTAAKPEVLEALLPELVSHHVGSRVPAFGKGLAAGASDLMALWQQLVAAFALAPEQERSPNVLRGFLRGAVEREPTMVAGILDNAVGDPLLGPWFPVLQTAVEIGECGAARLEAALQLSLAPAWTYEYVMYGRGSDSIPPASLRRIVLAIADLPDGYAVAVEVLAMHLASVRRSGGCVADEVTECGRELLSRWSGERHSNLADYHLAELASGCCAGPEAVPDVVRMCRHLAAALNEHHVDAGELTSRLFGLHPTIALDQFFGETISDARVIAGWRHIVRRGNPLDNLPIETLLEWARVKPSTRFTTLAAVITPFRDDDKEAAPAWTPAAMQLLRHAPDRVAALAELSSALVPWSWSGSRADILERRRSLLCAFLTDADPNVASWSRQRDYELEQLIQRERRRDQREDEGFE
jgi:hypothetical protein